MGCYLGVYRITPLGPVQQGSSFANSMDTGIIGPVTDMKDFVAQFGGSQSATIHGLIVSSILIPAAISSFFAGFLADKFGRSKGISIGVFVFGVGAAIEAAAVHLAMFIIGRVVEGVGEDLFLGTLVVYDLPVRRSIQLEFTNFEHPSRYICEISPTRVRGTFTTGPQLLITLGLVTGFFTCYGTSGIQSSMSWRTPFIVLASLSMALSMVSLFFLPPSPRWLTIHGREGEATEAWNYLGVSQAEREKVEIELENAVSSPEEVREKGTNVTRMAEIQVQAKPRHALLDLFSRDVRSRTGLAVFMMGMQQLSGIDGVLYVSLFQLDSALTHH